MEYYNVIPLWFAIILVATATLVSIVTFFDKETETYGKIYTFMMLIILYILFYKNYF